MARSDDDKVRERDRVREENGKLDQQIETERYRKTEIKGEGGESLPRENLIQLAYGVW